MTRPTRLRLATRGSPLALIQAGIVAASLEAHFASQGEERPVIERVVVRTEGDLRHDADLDRIGGQGVFVKEVQTAVLERRAEVAVHSAKDLPPVAAEGLTLAAVPGRADPRDALVGRPLFDLRPGAVVATGSARRRAQLANLRPDLVFASLRGNMARRLDHARDGSADGVVAAAAALDRLGWQDRIAERLPCSWCLPQVGQGALALECREDDAEALAALGALDDPEEHRVLLAERAFLAALGAGCRLPVAARGETLGPDGGIRLQGMIASGDGRIVVRGERSGVEPAALGAGLARHLLVDRGASAIEQWDAALTGTER